MIGVCWSVFFLAVLSTEIVSGTTDPCQIVDACQDGVNRYECTCPADDGGEAGCVCFNTPGVFNYTVLHDKGVQIQHEQKSLQFEVKACSNAHVLLMKSCTNQYENVYEIVIGGWQNTKSVIRTKKKDNIIYTCNHIVGPLNCSERKSFWIDWKDGVINVGYGGYEGLTKFMNTNVLKPEIRYVAISTYDNVIGNWMFNASQSSACKMTSVYGKTAPHIEGISTSNTQATALTTGNKMAPLAEDTATVTSTIDIQHSTPTIETPEINQPNNSTCTCPCHVRFNQTEKERAMYLKSAIEQIKKELTMEKKNLSSVIRKNTSARDERLSAKIMGCTLGVCVLTTVFGSIIIGDLVRLGGFIWERFQ